MDRARSVLLGLVGGADLVALGDDVIEDILEPLVGEEAEVEGRLDYELEEDILEPLVGSGPSYLGPGPSQAALKGVCLLFKLDLKALTPCLDQAAFLSASLPEPALLLPVAAAAQVGLLPPASSSTGGSARLPTMRGPSPRPHSGVLPPSPSAAVPFRRSLQAVPTKKRKLRSRTRHLHPEQRRCRQPAALPPSLRWPSFLAPSLSVLQVNDDPTRRLT
ncbi:hypothetical protein BRADI_1g78123v3 [Brachypodium distachyon]|uniref:Uncharacterized protein n=1 Tax=Brachypodium distachyon TaxID=15368 RepID=A0A2K2DVR7_BRADI|nr:hypothetical protein BRADI_1g78123v3 [Brachypodium distachyon]